MCKFCTTEPLDCTDIAIHEIKLMVGDRICGEETLELSYHVFDNDTPEHHLVAKYTINNSFDKGCIEVPIKYCPFCGRKVHND
jgi:uncharacterized protein (UPF0212 family)